MKKNYLIILFFLSLSAGFSQIRIVEVTPATNTIVIENFGGTSADISSWWTCHRFNYSQLSSSTVVTGSLNIPAGNQVELIISGSMNATSSDLGLYNASSFGSTTAMEDFLQWGAGGIGRENVAVAKGIWAAGTFIAGSVTPPYAYTGNGSTDNGVAFWDALLGTSENNFENQVRIFPNPNSGQFTIKSALHPITEIKIFNVLGKMVYQQNTSQVFNMNMGMDLKTGIYLVELYANNNKTIKRMVIQ
jgi:hypothetical protein